MAADKSAPRVIVETPVDSEFCSARQNAQSQLAKHKFVLDSQHGGGSAQVQMIWELHPAIVTVP